MTPEPSRPHGSLPQSTDGEASAKEAVGAEAEPEEPTTGAEPDAQPGPEPTAEPEPSSPLADLEGEPPSRLRRRVMITAGVLAAVLAAVYLGAAWWVSDRIPPGASVAGVQIGGLPHARAVELLDSELAAIAQEPFTVVADGSQSVVDPLQAGLVFDAEATVESMTEFSWDPRAIVAHFLGAGPQPAVSAVDDDALTAAVTAAATELAVAPVEGEIVFANARPVVTEPVDGSEVDIDEAIEQLRTEWLTGDRPLELTTAPIAPVIGGDAIEEALTTLAEPLVSAPVSFVAGEPLMTLSVEQLASVGSFEAVGEALELRIDGEALIEIVQESVDDLGDSPMDARIELKDRRPVVIPAVIGSGLDPVEVEAAVAAAAVSTGDRTAVVELNEAEPEFTTADAEALGVVERVGYFATPLPGYADPPRTANIELGASRVSGVLLLPGETFSLERVLAPFNAANGYHQSGVVQNGFESVAYGGGLSQLSTTVFNAAYEAGLEDVTHRPHSRWFSRYPEGREATLYEGQIDMQFRNDTDYGVLLDAWVADGQTHAAIWSTDISDVTIITGPRYAFTEARTVYNTLENCVPESGGSAGFSVDISRKVIRDGEVVHDNAYSWTYQPWHRVVCGADPG